MAASQAQLDYWLKYEKTVEYMTVTFYHPDFGYVHLVANQFKAKQFMFNGVLTEFTPVQAEIPTQPANNEGQARAQIRFGRIGIEFRQKLRMIKQNFIPIQAIMCSYIGTGGEPDNQFNLFVDKNGIAMDESNVTVGLGYENPMTLQCQYFYDPRIWTGLQQ
jgi:hypothetical protein